MKRHSLPHRPGLAVLVAVMALAALAPAAEDNSYTVHNLVADTPGTADHTDPNLINGWGLTASPTSPWWVSDNGTNVSTIYRADGTIVPLVVQVPTHPTGAVFWSPTARAFFVFATEVGTIRGWHPSQGNQTVVLADRSAQGAIYKGLAIASTTGATASMRRTSTTPASTSSTAASPSSAARVRLSTPGFREDTRRSGSRTSADASS